jgi:hypothetical protein
MGSPAYSIAVNTFGAIDRYIRPILLLCDVGEVKEDSVTSIAGDSVLL